jgi:4-diphosphocytidyl-2-C-methyl-D-erythritol kinase
MICGCATFRKAADRPVYSVVKGARRSSCSLFLRVRVPAKVNLWLEILRKRDDGYHDLSSLMLPVGIYDYLELTSRKGKGISLECDAPRVPADGSNLAWRAAEAFLSTIGSKDGVHIRIAKNIPAAAGLGGGSADAAAVLLALNGMHRNSFTLPQLESLGLELGADVPFFLHQRPALATGIGEMLCSVDGLPDYPLVLVKPPLSVSTRWVYQSLKLTRGGSRIKLCDFVARPWQLLEVMHNDLETVTLTAYPVLDEIKQWLLDQGAVGALMSGSGPTVFGVFGDRGQAEQIGILAKRRWPGCWISVAQAQGSATIQEE